MKPYGADLMWSLTKISAVILVIRFQNKTNKEMNYPGRQRKLMESLGLIAKIIIIIVVMSDLSCSKNSTFKSFDLEFSLVLVLSYSKELLSSMAHLIHFKTEGRCFNN